MSSYLIITPSRELYENINNSILEASNKAIKLGNSDDSSEKLTENYRFRHLSSVSEAEKWVSFHPLIGGVFVDQCFGTEDILALFIELWKTYPELLCAIVSTDSLKNEFNSLLSLGVLDLTGQESIRMIFQVLNTQAKDISLTGIKEHNAILVVEDLDSPRDIICSLVESFGYNEVHGVSSVDDAIFTLKKAPFKYFCVITDLNMPKKSGLTLISEIRKDELLRFLPVIVLTSDPSKENLLQAIKFGVSGFLAKPPRRELLKAELQKSKRLVLFGKSPELGTKEEIALLEEVLRKQKNV